MLHQNDRYKKISEQELAEYCVAGDRLAKDELCRRYAAMGFTVCRRYTGNADDAADMMQETIITALNKIASYKGKGSLGGWIRKIAINTTLNQLKRQRWQTISFDALFNDTIPDPSEHDIDLIPQEKLLEWISKLPDIRKVVFNMYCIDGYSHKKIGEMLGISEKGSASMLAKARKQLKEEINNYLKEKEL